ncbi:hypothetical protein OHR86_14345 [Streptomyces sp. NBC_00441]|uniref:hypothetical protein n=1 Tax=Streptomyces sp. NBC_00441 TaxID=2975742 RepID=UPI002E29A07B|nr:hypothetical protein [Streptomyces sp. NBC_00441]
MRSLMRRISAAPPRRVMLTAAGSLLAVASVAVVVHLTEDTSAPPHRVSTAEAQRFALARLSRFEASPAGIEITVPLRDRTIGVEGVIDYRSHHAVGRFDGAGGGLLAWDGWGVGVALDQPSGQPGPQREPSRPARLALSDAAHMPTSDWVPRRYTSDPLDSMLKLSMLLGRDRPENAQLLAQSGARWTGTAEIGGRTYDVFAAPRPTAHSGNGQPSAAPRRTGDSPLRFFVSADGELRRVTTQLPGQARPGVIDFTASRLRHAVPPEPWSQVPGGSAPSSGTPYEN